MRTRSSPPIRRFLTERNGNVAIIFGLVALGLFVAIGAAADLMHGYQIKNRLNSACDSAALAAASSGKTAQSDLQTIAQNFVTANFQSETAVSNITVQLTRTTAPSTITVTASGTLNQTFLGAAPIGISATSQVVLTSTGGAEVALVLDNTGSMNTQPDGATQSNIMALKQAAGQFVTTVFGATATNNQWVRVGVVPYASAANAGTLAPSLINPAGAPVLTLNDATGWAGCVVERPSTFQNFSTKPSYTVIAADLDKPANAANGYLSPYVWQSDDDTCNNPPPTATPPGWNNYVDTASIYSKYSCHANNQWGNQWNSPSPILQMPWTNGNTGPGPDMYCPAPVVPLVNSVAPLFTALGLDGNGKPLANSGLQAYGSTFGSLGMAWGYRVLSPSSPFKGIGTTTVGQFNTAKGTAGTAARVSDPNPWTTAQWKKYVVLMTDGVNETDNIPYSGFGPYQSSFTVSLIDSQEEAVCDALRSQGVTIYTIAFTGGTPTAALSYCAGTAVGDGKGNAKYAFNVSSQAELTAAFQSIGSQISHVRISQ